jgi:hypothetical protein
MLTGFPEQDRLINEINMSLRAAGEYVWQRFPLPTQHPSFKSCRLAAERMITELKGFNSYLVMRDQCLRPVREAVLGHGKTLVVSLRHGAGVMEIPASAIGGDGVLRLSPLPSCAKPYDGAIDVVVVACHVFDAKERRLYSFELEQTQNTLDELRQGLVNGWSLPSTVPVVCVAADQQQVHDWPESAKSWVRACAVFTPTRTILLGSGDVFEGPGSKGR